ncbi:MAG: ATP-binding protein, partial [Albidovulum sp.]
MFIVSYLLRISLGVIADALERARLEIREREAAQKVLQNREIDIRQLNASLEERVVARTEQLYAAKEAAEAAGRAKGLFLAHMSHELRTPLSGLLRTIELLTKTPLTPEQQQLLQTAQLSGDSLLSVINDVLDFSKVEAGRLVLVPEQVNLRTLLEDSAAMLAENAHRKGLELVLDIDADLPPALLVDSLRIRQVVTNLLGNAIKFTTTGTVVLRASLQARHAQQAQILVEVQDTGIGIQPDELPKLFQAFAQADSSMARRFGGTGLGLVLCKRLIEAMSGTIGVNSQPGRGSTFHFTLNLAVISDSVSAVNIPLLPSALQSVVLYGGSQLGAPATLRALTGLLAKVEHLSSSESV